MKRTILFTAFILLVLFSGIVSAQEAIPCQGVSEITIVQTTPQQRDVIQRALTNYDESRVSEGNYCVVFNIQDAVGIRLDSLTLSIDVENFLRNHGDHDIYISGLNLSTRFDISQPFLTITNNTTSRVIVNGLQMTNVKNGLKLMGTGPIEVRGSTITGIGGDPATRTGQCVDVQSAGAVVKSSTISNCGEGIKIAASNVFLGAADAEHLADMNDVHDNGIGIHLVSGAGNKWPYNLVRRNGIENSENVADSGILINAGANGDIARPAVVADMETGAVLRCQTDQAGAILKRELNFIVPRSGNVSIYLSDGQEYKQAIEYVGTCHVDENGVCVLENTLLSFRQNTCGLSDIFITALFTSDNSSMLLADSVDLGRTSSIIMPTGEGPIDVPGANDDDESENGIGLDGLYVESAETGGNSGGGSSGGTGGNSGGNLSSAIASKMGCSFSAEGGSAFKRILEMWWIILILFFPKFVLNRRDP